MIDKVIKNEVIKNEVIKNDVILWLKIMFLC
jgi:hypothetical protein